MSLRIAPPSSHKSSTSNTTQTSNSTGNLPKGAPSAPGIPDTLRSTSSSSHALLSSNNNTTTTATTSSSSADPPTLSSTHPLESRLRAWTATQDNLKHEMLRRTYGIAEPVRRGMELQLVREGDWRPGVLSGSGCAASVHEDVLTGRDCEMSWDDVYGGEGNVVGGAGGAVEGGVHDEIEARMGMWKW